MRDEHAVFTPGPDGHPELVTPFPAVPEPAALRPAEHHVHPVHHGRRLALHSRSSVRPGACSVVRRVAGRRCRIHPALHPRRRQPQQGKRRSWKTAQRFCVVVDPFSLGLHAWLGHSPGSVVTIKTAVAPSGWGCMHGMSHSPGSVVTMKTAVSLSDWGCMNGMRHSPGSVVTMKTADIFPSFFSYFFLLFFFTHSFALM